MALVSDSRSELADHVSEVRPRGKRMVKKQVPPDGQRAWLIVFCAYLVSVVVSGLPSSFGPLKAAIGEEFSDAYPSTMKQFPSLVKNLNLLLSPFATVMVLKCGARLTLFVGGMFCVIGLGLSCFAKAAGFLVFSYGVLVGIGASLVVSSFLTQIARLFTDRKALAFAFYLCGECTGAVVLPFLIDFFLGDYGWRMVFFVLCILHVPTCLAAAAFEGPEYYFREVDVEEEIENPEEARRETVVPVLEEVSGSKMWKNIRDCLGLEMMWTWNFWLIALCVSAAGFGSAGLSSLFDNDLKEHGFPIGHAYCFTMTVFVRFTYGLFSAQSRIPRNTEFFLSSLANVGGTILLLGVGCETVAHYLVVMCLMAVGNGIWGILTPLVIGENIGSIPKAFALVKFVRGFLSFLFPLLKDFVAENRSREVMAAMNATLVCGAAILSLCLCLMPKLVKCYRSSTRTSQVTSL